MSARETLTRAGLVWLFLTSCDGSAPTAPQGAGDFFIENEGITIAGTLDLPSSAGPYAVMIFVPGSGTETRETDRPVGEIVLPQGVALFTYDKRGLGQSTGVFEEVSNENSVRVLNDRASDVLAIVDFLASHKDIDANQIFLWGSSQGGWVVPLVARETEHLAFIICSSGGGSSVGISNYYDELADDESLSIAELTAMLADFNGVHGYDPRPTLQSLTIPALWVYGGMDRSNPTFFDLEIIERIRLEHDKDFTIFLFPNTNHELIDVTTGEFDPQLFPAVIEWRTIRLGG